MGECWAWGSVYREPVRPPLPLWLRVRAAMALGICCPYGIPMRETDKFKVVDGGLGRRTPKEFASEKPYLLDLGHKG